MARGPEARKPGDRHEWVVLVLVDLPTWPLKLLLGLLLPATKFHGPQLHHTLVDLLISDTQTGHLHVAEMVCKDDQEQARPSHSLGAPRDGQQEARQWQWWVQALCLPPGAGAEAGRVTVTILPWSQPVARGSLLLCASTQGSLCTLHALETDATAQAWGLEYPWHQEAADIQAGARPQALQDAEQGKGTWECVLLPRALAREDLGSPPSVCAGG